MCELVLDGYVDLLGLDNLLYVLMLVYGFFRNYTHEDVN